MLTKGLREEHVYARKARRQCSDFKENLRRTGTCLLLRSASIDSSVLNSPHKAYWRRQTSLDLERQSDPFAAESVQTALCALQRALEELESAMDDYRECWRRFMEHLNNTGDCGPVVLYSDCARARKQIKSHRENLDRCQREYLRLLSNDALKVLSGAVWISINWFCSSVEGVSRVGCALLWCAPWQSQETFE